LIYGFNIAILTGLLLAMSRPLFGLRRSAWFVLLGIALYTVLVGADAAVVRASKSRGIGESGGGGGGRVANRRVGHH